MSFPRYPAYKASGVEWLGEVPEHSFQRAKGPTKQQPRATPWVNERETRLALKGRSKRWIAMGSPLQGSGHIRLRTQGVALGCYGAGRWPSRCGDAMPGDRS